MMTILLAICGVLCKEQALMLLPVSVGFQLLQSKWECCKKNQQKSCQKAAGLVQMKLNNQLSKQMIAMITATLIIGQTRLTINGTDPWPHFSHFDNPIANMKGSIRWLNGIRLAMENLRLVFLPIGLSCDWSHGSLQLITKWTEWMTCFCLLSATMTIYGIIKLIIKLNRQPQPHHFVVGQI